jgi:hypothetical protein
MMAMMKRAAAKNGRSTASKKRSGTKRGAAVPSRKKSASKTPDAGGYDAKKTAEALWDLADYFIL